MIILDIEASGLGDESYPIEIAWSHRFHKDRRDSFLIRPPGNWTHWDEVAEQLHGIQRESLLKSGIDVKDAVKRLENALTGETVYTDAVYSDRPWMMTLFRAAGRRELSFQFGHVQSLLPPHKVSLFIERLYSSGTSHRALADVDRIIQALDYLAPS